MTAIPVTSAPRLTQLVGTYYDYPAAERAVALLADRGFPVETVRIVGRDVQLHIRMAGRPSPWRAVGVGALTGMWLGALIGLFLAFATPYFTAPLLWGLLLGALFGGMSAGLLHLRRRGTPRFDSTQDIAAESYDLLVPHEMYWRASGILAEESRPDEAPIDRTGSTETTDHEARSS